MADANKTLRQKPVEGAKFANAGVLLDAANPASRIALRATARGATEFGKKIGLEMPTRPGGSASNGGRVALWVGPDEWLILDELKPISDLMPSRESKIFSAVDVSHRNTAFIVSGDGAANVLNAGCPRDLSLASFPVGTVSRTIFGKAEVVLWRTGKARFRLECWRSFAPYVWDYLLDAAIDAQI